MHGYKGISLALPPDVSGGPETVLNILMDPV